MKIRLSYVLFALFMIVGACIAIFFYGYFTHTPYVEPPSPLTIRVADCYYSEVSEDKLAALSLSVASCDGLREFGAVDAESRNGLRPIWDEWKKNYTSVSVSVGDKAYAYPDARYPNLIVAPVDGEPAIFQFCNAIHEIKIESVESVYGSFTPDSVDYIVIRVLREENGNYEPDITVSDRAALTAFCDACHAFESAVGEKTTDSAEDIPLDSPENIQLEASAYPRYDVEIHLSNGESVPLLCRPKLCYVSCKGVPFSNSDGKLVEWFESHAK